MPGINFFVSCPRCGNLALGWTEDGVTTNVRCRICGFEGRLPHPDLKNGAWRVQRIRGPRP